MTQNRDNNGPDVKPGATPEVTVKRKGTDPKTLAQPQVVPPLEQLDPHFLSEQDQELIRHNEQNAQSSIAAAYEASKAKEAQAKSQRVADADAHRKFQQFLDNRVDNILPQLPQDDPVWAYAWVPYEETVNKVDNLRSRLMAGYVPVKWGDIEGFDQRSLNSRTATIGDFLCFNELVAVRIERAVRDLYLEHYHHKLPNQLEGNIRETVESSLGSSQFGDLNNTDMHNSEFGKLGKDRKKADFTGV